MKLKHTRAFINAEYKKKRESVWYISPICISRNSISAGLRDQELRKNYTYILHLRYNRSELKVYES